MALAKIDHQLKEAKDIAVGIEPAPVQPRFWTVDVIRIRITRLRLEKLVARAKHRRAIGKKKQTAKILHLLLS